MYVVRTTEVVGAFIMAFMLVAVFAAADKFVSTEDSDGGEFENPWGFAYVRAYVGAMIDTPECLYYGWIHNHDDSTAYPYPYDWDGDWDNHGNGDRRGGWT